MAEYYIVGARLEDADDVEFQSKPLRDKKHAAQIYKALQDNVGCYNIVMYHRKNRIESEIPETEIDRILNAEED